MRRFLGWSLLAVLLSQLGSLPALAVQEVRIGVLSFRPLEQTRQQWQATEDYLNRNVAGDYHFTMEPLFLKEMNSAAAQRRFDYILTNPNHYVLLRSHYGLAVIATLMPVVDGRPVDSFGGVVFTRAGREDIRDFADLRKRKVAAAEEQSFGAYVVQRWALYEQGIQIGEMGEVLFTGMPQDNVVRAVLSGRVDAGFVRTGVLENMAREGKLKLDQIKVLNPQHEVGFPQLLSTRLYPEWAFSVVPGVPEALTRKVMLALLRIRPEDAAARSGDYYGFTPPGNYAPVEAVMLRLKTNPDLVQEFDLRDILNKYMREVIVAGTLLLVLVLVTLLYLAYANRKLRLSFAERERLDDALQQANATLEHKVAQRTDELQQSEARLRDIMQSSPIAIRIAVDNGRRVVFANAAYEHLIGAGQGESIGVDPAQYYADPAQYRMVLQMLAAGHAVTDRMVELHFADQRTNWVLASYTMFHFEGEPAILAWFYDVTPLKQAEQALKQSEARFRQMFERHSSPMLLIDPDNGAIINANPAAAMFYGYPVPRMRLMNIDEINVLSPADVANQRRKALNEQRNYFVFPHRLADGRVRTVEIHSSPVEVDGKRLLFSVIHDITERQELQQQMHELAFYDALTGLPNRRLLLDRLGKALATATRAKRHGALMFLDLDHFKSLNDLHGHDIGDQLLVEVARRLREAVREDDSVARLGGDEFVVLLENLSLDLEEAGLQAESVAEKMRLALAEPYHLQRQGGEEEGQPILHYCSSSIGIAMFRDHEEGVEQLLKWADMAMYRAKEAGRNSIRFFDPAMQSAVETRAVLELDMHQALAQGQFELYYQVQVDAARRPLAAEVLLRWNHPRRGRVSPLEFIPLAEETGLIRAIGAWVLEATCVQIRAWHGHPLLGNLALSVNVSARQFRQEDFVEQVQATVMRHGIAPTSLKLELTESLVLEDVDDSIIKMRALKEFGISLSMDDFGTGYSSLAYLKNLPLNQLKIDQSFVRSIASDSADRVLVMSIVDLGMNFELDVVAEGVETEAQFTLLHRYGCGIFQGYLFGRPLAVADFERHVLTMGASASVRRPAGEAPAVL